MGKPREFKNLEPKEPFYRSGRIEMTDYEMSVKIRLETERLFGK